MGEIVNPYIAGAPVTEQRMFFGREDIFRWIGDSMAGQYADHILVVHGQRRVGKTSVLKQLGNRLPKKYIPVFFDLQGRTHTTLDRFLWWLAREIVRVLKQERGIEVPPPEKEDFSKDPDYFENRFLPDLKPVLDSKTLLLTFDEFDNLEESEVKDELARPLVDYLRRLMGQPSLNFIFSIGSSGRKLENMQAAYTEFFKTALYKKISFLTEEQTHDLVTRPVRGVLEYERAAVDRIYAIASGHPYFTQLTCHELFARCQRTEQRSIARDDVEAVLDDVVERGTVNLKFVWDEASDIEKWSLAALAQLDQSDNRTLTDYLGKNRVRFSESDLTSGLLHLREKDVITPQNRFVIHLLRRWLQKNRPIEQAREELTEANPIANRYIEIGLEFRDSRLYDKAIESFQQALSISKDNLQAQVNIALAYMDQSLYDKAIVEFEKALTMDDEDVSARNGLCEAHLALGDSAMTRGHTKEAVLSYQRVLGINSEHTEARGRMAELSRQRAEKALSSGRDEDALSAFAEALRFTPEDSALIERVEKVRAEKNAKVLAEQAARSEKEAAFGNWDKAIAALNEALEIAPGDESILKKIESIKAKQLQERLDAILLKVDAAEKAGRWDGAIAGLNEYLQLKPDAAVQKRIADLMEAKHAAWLGAITARADRAVAVQNWDEALAALNEALKLEPNNKEMQARAEEAHEARRIAELDAMLKRADQAVEAGHWDEAIGILNNGLASNPENEILKTKLAGARKSKREARLRAALRLADGAAQTGKWEAAVEALNDVLAVEPDNAEFLDKLAEIRQLERESKLNSLRTQARSLLAAEKFDEALEAWNAYLAFEPGDPKKAQAEIEAVKQAKTLAALYSEASNVYAAKNYEKAIDLFKRIVVVDADYKDATELLAELVRLRRAAQKAPRAINWRILAVGGLVLILALGIGGGLFWVGKYGLPAIPIPMADKTAAPTHSSNPSPTMTPAPELDPEIQSALDIIQSEEPLYQTSFDDWEFGELPENAALENGKLIVRGGENQSTYVSHTNFQSDRFAIQFEIQILESVQGGGCLLNIGTDGEYSMRNIFMPSGELEVDHLEMDGYEITIGNGQFDPSNVSTTTLIVLNDQISLFVDGKWAFTAQDPEGSAVYANVTYEADSHMICGFDNFKYWDLREMDSAVKIALDTIQSEEPLYQTSFDSWDAGWYSRGDTRVENGKLILASEDQEGVTVGLYNLNSDRYAIEYELSVREAGVNGHCVSENTVGNRFLSFVFFGNGETALNKSFSDIAVGSYDETQPNKVTLLILGDQLASFVNGQISYSALDPEGGVAYAYQSLSAYYKIACEIDNFKIWDLSGMDFAAAAGTTSVPPTPSVWVTEVGVPIFTYVVSHPPTFEDDFSVRSNAWGNTSEAAPVSDMLRDGALSISKRGGNELKFPLNGLFDSSDFALQFHIEFNSNAPSTNIAVHFRSSASQDTYYRFKLSDTNKAATLLNSWQLIEVVKGSTGAPAGGSVKLMDGFNDVWILVRGNHFAVYVNQVPLTEQEITMLYGRNVFFVVNTEPSTDYVRLDNVKFWNLDRVDINP
jgi:tetratricopeptide (TPR) repeat protein